MEYFFAKAAKESAKGQPASPMDTWTAERPFARSSIKYPSAKNKFFADGYEISIYLRGYPFRRPCIHG
jgi:hypothetical protein